MLLLLIVEALNWDMAKLPRDKNPMKDIDNEDGREANARRHPGPREDDD